MDPVGICRWAWSWTRTLMPASEMSASGRTFMCWSRTVRVSQDTRPAVPSVSPAPETSLLGRCLRLLVARESPLTPVPLPSSAASHRAQGKASGTKRRVCGWLRGVSGEGGWVGGVILIYLIRYVIVYQQVLELPYKTALKMTIARYHTPSGRCIQVCTSRYVPNVYLMCT
jgi:hypothetical protein